MMPRRAELCARFVSFALLWGCGRGALSSDDGDRSRAKLDACSNNPLLNLKPAIQVDAVELRMSCRVTDPRGATARALLSSGTSCASGACAADVDALDRRLQGWIAPRPPAWPCKQYLVGMRKDRVVISAANDAELRSFLGPFDTRGEAELLVRVHEITCFRSGEDRGRFLIASSAEESECSGQMQDVLYSVDARGVLDRLPREACERGSAEGTGAK